MKLLLRILVVHVCLFAAHPAHGAISDGLAGLYQFSGNLLDGSGSAQVTNGAVNSPQFTAGKIGQAMWLPGVRDYMSLAAPAGGEFDFGSPTTGDAVDFSMSMWIRQDNALSDPAVLSNKNWANGANTGINWAVNGNGIFDLNTKADVGVRRDLDTAATSHALTVGAWNLVVMTVDRDGSTKLYINGTNTGTIPSSSQGDFNAGLPWNVGQDGTGAYSVEFTGAVDELAIWRRALTSVEASQLWNGGSGIDLSTQIVEPALKLVVDRPTGRMTIENNTGAAQPLIGYEIDSAAGAFNPTQWTKVTARLDASGDHSIDADDGWVVLSQPGARSDFSEASLGEGLLAAGAQVELGIGAWAKYFEDASDVTFQYATPTDDAPRTGIVQFVGNGGASFDYLDLNYDGAVNVSDYATLLAGYHLPLANASAAQQHALGDLNGDGVHSVRDFLAFKERFDRVRGAGAFAAMLAGAGVVPEPTTASLCLFVALVIAFLRHIPCSDFSGLQRPVRR